MDIVLASNNAGKIRELSQLLKDFNINFIPQASFGVIDAEETGLTFVENALIKARHAALQTGLPAIADDSGLVVNALLGAPGIYSARYAGKETNDQRNITKLLEEMRPFTAEERKAYFYCCLVYMQHANDPTPIICEGRWEGYVLTAPRGENGFGYDPIFYLPEKDKTAAELALTLKNEISHRGRALRALTQALMEK